MAERNNTEVYRCGGGANLSARAEILGCNRW